MAWRSECIVLVLDTETEWMLTGGTQPTCHKSDLFAKPAMTVKQLRVGGEFAEAIHGLSTDFAQLAEGAKRSASIATATALNELTPSDIEEKGIYNQMVYENRSNDWFPKIPTPTESHRILSWACNGLPLPPEASSQFKAPCLRCQRIYSTWSLQDMPTDIATKKRSLLEMYGYLVPKDPLMNMAWSYCAETAAASKLYLLRHGKVGLV
jgi:hypothetical protein